MDKRNGTKGQTTIYKTLHIKLKIETKRTPQKFTENSDATEGYSVPVPHVEHCSLDFKQQPFNQ
jgi:hypothetical protein